MKVYISGIHCGPDPSPGVGIASSLRLAFPELRIVGVDYSARSTGLHADVFDDIYLRRPWDEVDLGIYADQVLQFLGDSDTFWISGLDVEIAWLAQAAGPHPRLLLPSAAALERTGKPELRASAVLGLQVPESISATMAEWTLHEFCRRHNWDIWVKSRYHGAVRARSWREVRAGLLEMGVHWRRDDLFLQAHVDGNEQCIAFAAHRGTLVGAMVIEKRILTETGKTWAARVAPVDNAVLQRLACFLADTGWTGDGELETVCAHDGAEYLFDLNPRFPAYIHGVTLCGTNLPGMLVAAAAQLKQPRQSSSPSMFARVVTEVLARQGLPIPPLECRSAKGAAFGKHPSLQPALLRRVAQRGRMPQSRWAPDDVPVPTGWQEALSAVKANTRTPRRLALRDGGVRRLDEISERIQGLGPPEIAPALSVKTLPEQSLASAANGRGWWAEVISADEFLWAKRLGFPPERIVVNGPTTPMWLSQLQGQPSTVFFDSVAALKAGVSCTGIIPGVRLRPPWLSSRFGVPLDDPRAFMELVETLSGLGAQPVGLSLHLPCDSLGTSAWWTAANAAVHWAQKLTELAGVESLILDFGGGWHPDDFDALFLPMLPDLLSRICATLPGVQRLLIEPGKAVSMGAYALLSTIVELRTDPDGARSAIVDASIADLPMAHLMPHRLLHVPATSVDTHWVGAGEDRIYGGICMESDVLAHSIASEYRIQPGMGTDWSSSTPERTTRAWRGLLQGGSTVMVPESLLSYLKFPSCPGHHGRKCCATAWAWASAMDKTFSGIFGARTPPAWLSSRYPWGPSRWPIHWCELVHAARLDCGVLAGVSTLLLRARGMDAESVQLIQEFSHHDCAAWQAEWSSQGRATRWIDDPYIYHECCALRDGEQVHLWNPSQRRWFDPQSDLSGLGRIVAVRAFGKDSNWQEPLFFGSRRLTLGGWTAMEDSC